MMEVKLAPLNRPALLLLKDMENLVGAEIGVAYGGNARHMLVELDIKKLYLIDPYTKFSGVIREKAAKGSTFKEAVKILKPWEDKIVWLNDKSSSAVKHIPDGSLDFVYIDGDHRLKPVIKDIVHYWPKVKMGGLIGGHDYFYKRKQVVKAVDKCFDIVESKQCIGSKSVDWWVWKTDDKQINKISKV
jgi:predicted O-methyltransferase YrrM